MDVIDTIYEMAHKYPGGVEALAHRMQKNPDTLRKKVLPTNDTHELTVKELIKLIDYCDTDTVAQSFADHRGLICIKKPDFEGLSDNALLDLFLDLQAKQGMWARSVSKALEDGNVCWDEFKEIQKHYNEYVVAGAEAMNRIAACMAESEQRKSARAKK